MKPNNICLIIPYFGKFPSYFQIWLDSAKLNDDCVDFCLITDQEVKDYKVPQNVKIIKQEFRQLVNYINKKFDFEVAIKKPYKLCDLKPAYGDNFASLVKGYDYWGFCDLDLIFGKLSPFLKKYSLIEDKIDKFGCLGHLEIIRNTKENNLVYKFDDEQKMRNYRYVFSRPYAYAFDEQFSFNILAKEKHLKIEDLLQDQPFSDIYPFSYRFRDSFKDSRNVSYKYFIFDKGKGLKEINILNDGRRVERNSMYLHLQKRVMRCNITSEYNNLIIYPNAIDYLERFDREKIYKPSKIQDFIYKSQLKLKQIKKVNSIKFAFQKLQLKQFFKNSN